MAGRGPRRAARALSGRAKLRLADGRDFERNPGPDRRGCRPHPRPGHAALCPGHTRVRVPVLGVRRTGAGWPGQSAACPGGSRRRLPDRSSRRIPAGAVGPDGRVTTLGVAPRPHRGARTGPGRGRPPGEVGRRSGPSRGRGWERGRGSSRDDPRPWALWNFARRGRPGRRLLGDAGRRVGDGTSLWERGGPDPVPPRVLTPAARCGRGRSHCRSAESTARSEEARAQPSLRRSGGGPSEAVVRSVSRR
jgi:hypothetical protein